MEQRYYIRGMLRVTIAGSILSGNCTQAFYVDDYVYINIHVCIYVYVYVNELRHKKQIGQ